MNKDSFIEDIKNYNPDNPEERAYRLKFLQLLKNENCYSRESLEAHFTASAWITNPSLSKVLLLHHFKLDRWLQPGGHADNETNLLNVAKKELQEETGIEVDNQDTTFFDIDIHTIPQRKEVPEHEHFDVRFHFIVNEETSLTKNKESNQIKWFNIEEVAELTKGELSFKRMINKTLARK